MMHPRGSRVHRPIGMARADGRRGGERGPNVGSPRVDPLWERPAQRRWNWRAHFRTRSPLRLRWSRARPARYVPPSIEFPDRRDRCSRGHSGAWYAVEVRDAVKGDLTRTALELLKRVGAGAEREGEGPAGAPRRHADALLHEEASVRGRRRGLPDDRPEGPHQAAPLVDEDATAGGPDEDMPAGGDEVAASFRIGLGTGSCRAWADGAAPAVAPATPPSAMAADAVSISELRSERDPIRRVGRSRTARFGDVGSQDRAKLLDDRGSIRIRLGSPRERLEDDRRGRRVISEGEGSVGGNRDDRLTDVRLGSGARPVRPIGPSGPAAP